MLNNNLNTKQTVKLVDTLVLDGLVRVIMPESVLNQIKYLCRAINKVEWSGVLIYRPIGNIWEESFQIELVDIIPMNKGTAVYTEYAFDETIPMYLMENNLLDCKLGHIHSHNTMNVFFSGTDNDELMDNSPKHNFYVSLIVNNFMDFECKIAWRGKANVAQVLYSCKNHDGVEWTIPGEPIEKEVMFISKTQVLSPIEHVVAPEAFMNKVDGIIREAERKAKATQGATPGSNVIKYPAQKSPEPYVSPHDAMGWGKAWTEWEDDLITVSKTNTKEENDIEEFGCMLIRLGNPIDGDDIDTALEDMEAVILGEAPGVAQTPVRELISSILSMYPAIYQQYWNEFTSAEESFVDRTGNTIGMFEEYEHGYPFLSEIIMALKSMLAKYINNQPTTPSNRQIRREKKKNYHNKQKQHLNK